MNSQSIKIEPAKDIHELLENVAVMKALDFAFRKNHDEFKLLVTDKEYAIVARAFWTLYTDFSPPWCEESSVVSAGAGDPDTV